MRLIRLLLAIVFGPERKLCWRVAKQDYWFSGHYAFKPDEPCTTFTRTFRNHPVSVTTVTNPFYCEPDWDEVARSYRRDQGEEA